ncbi:MAG: hypothetical protein ACREFP_19395 [Acetobacteraceae bacterium]
MTPIANMNDAAICEVAAASLKNHDAAGRRAIMVGAIFFSVRGVSKTTGAALLTSIAGALAGGPQRFVAMPDARKRAIEASASNYVSRCRAAVMPEHFPWQIDPKKALSEAADEIFPEFCAKWPTVNSIKRSGPDVSPRRKTAPSGSDAVLSAEQAEHGAADYFTSLRDLLPRFDVAMLLEMQAAIAGEIARREEATLKQAA